MEEKRPKIKKRVNKTLTVLFPLSKNNFFHQHPDPYSSSRFDHFEHVSGISAMGALPGPGSECLVSLKKLFCFEHS
jgi:hypothetical protein